jgi:acyl-CoA reductase-like NAD-dependent aldehyde dehydrogenase
MEVSIRELEQKRTPIAVRNPWTGEYDYEIVPPTAAELRTTCLRLRAGQKAWAAAPLAHRIAVMSKWADRLEQARAALIEADSVDTGYCVISKLSPDIIIGAIRGWCTDAPKVLEEAARQGISSIMPSISFRSQLVPYPLLGVISPWNAPLMLSLLDAVPALLAGCAVIIKPSEIAPRFVEPLMATIREVPELADVLTYVVGDGETGQNLIDNVDIVCFTGSVATGRKVAKACARRLIPVYLELGGKDPVIVTASADIEQAATAVLRGAVWGTGQVCFSVERVYVHEDIHDAFVDTLVRLAEQVTLNYPDCRFGDIGPFGFEQQAAIVDAHLDDALAKGAVLRTGGKSQKLGGGLFMRPVVLTDVTHDMKIMREETFGPVMPVMRYRTEDEAVELANDTEYGLSAAVIAGTPEEAARIGERINAGTVSLQDTFLTLFKVRDIGSDSFNSSGLGGDRTGPGSILRFLRKKALMTNSACPMPLRNGGRR